MNCWRMPDCRGAVRRRNGKGSLRCVRRFGKRQERPAQLNIVDCAVCALAKVRSQPFLFKGDDFARTDIPSALACRATIKMRQRSHPDCRSIRAKRCKLAQQPRRVKKALMSVKMKGPFGSVIASNISSPRRRHVDRRRPQSRAYRAYRPAECSSCRWRCDAFFGVGPQRHHCLVKHRSADRMRSCARPKKVSRSVRRRVASPVRAPRHGEHIHRAKHFLRLCVDRKPRRI